MLCGTTVHNHQGRYPHQQRLQNKGWWVFITHLSLFVGVMLTWPDGNLYKYSGTVLRYSLYSKVRSCLQCIIKWMSVQASSPGRKTQNGSDRGGISVVDVERADVSVTLPVFGHFGSSSIAFSSNGSAPRM
ncbi:hypothetical protein FQN60_004800 [Etheostoma spectabile]|uniref:Uncharacterized protein n=1 Tax=Etheostoma spectabile TaxID=54343 RepID=A0A5J5DKP3_9PERO|nr:hypothetical protein FQN60_004800 [Etheostoma spectabile]